jgi:dynein heavy chain
MLEESDNRTPLVCLLSTGSDPSPQIEAIAKLRCQEMRQLSMGQGQEEAARKLLTDSIVLGYWLLLQVILQLSRGEICVANFIPPCEWCETW